eukprot:130873-Karenia_brevis.AAC.1
MYPFIALSNEGTVDMSPKSAIPESNVLPAAPSIVVLKFGTVGRTPPTDFDLIVFIKGPIH